jgi:hypothetical protein
VTEWQPIETAPKNGTAFLGYFPGRAGYWARQDVQPVYWLASSEDGRWMSPVSGHETDRPIHWMPLPPPPTETPHDAAR